MARVTAFIADMRRLAGVASPVLPHGVLHPAEQQRFAAMAGSKRRREFLLGRFLVRRALEHEYGEQTRSWRLETDTRGRPFVVAHGCIPPGISITHSGEWVACALCDANEVGVDIEALKPRDLNGLVSETLAPAEQAALLALPESDRLQVFYRFWTLKEAFLKALGRGLDLAPGELTFALGPPPRLISPPVDPRPWQFRSFRIAPECVGALAVGDGCTLQPVLLAMNHDGRLIPQAPGA